MNQDRRSALRATLALGAAVLPTQHLRAQGGWPSKPVRLIVAGGAGSGTDLVARVLAEGFTKTFGQPFVVEPKAGANGLIATEMAARTPNDGYNFLVTYAAAQLVNPLIMDKVGYDPIRDFAPVVQIGSAGNLLVVNPSVPATNLAELIAYVKSQPPDSLSYGSWGVGSGGHLTMEALMQQTGVKMRHVPYKSTALANADVMSGHLQLAFTATATAQPLVQSGKLRAVAMSGPVRGKQLPDVKTMDEQGVPFPMAAWYGVFAPAGTPRAIVEALNKDARRMFAAPELQERWSALGFSDMPIETSEQFEATVRRDRERWAEIVRRGNIKAE